MLLALARVAEIEKNVKETIVSNMLLFEKFPEVQVNQMGDQLKDAIVQSAALACDSHSWIGKAEFTVLCMKFGNSQLIQDAVQYLEKKVSKLLDFDQNKSSMVERKSMFSELVMRVPRISALIRNEKIEELRKAVDDEIKHERLRIKQVRDAKTEVTVYKTEGEVLQIEQCYANALAKIAPGQDLFSLTALEYCSMCIYYDS